MTDLRRYHSTWLALAAWGCLSLPLAEQASADEPIDFSRQIRPILADHCFQCHGPDEATREAGLRLDLQEGLFREQDGLTIVVPEHPEQSELIRRVATDDEFEQMPPRDSPFPLTQDEIELLKQWVKAGAPWEQHWAFQPPTRPPPPDVSDRQWPRNPIDSFVLQALEAQGQTPSDEADPITLVRRLTLDLTGLPPTPEQVDQFLNDPAPDRYERLVDRLLESPRYGERWVWDWLDAARYADTNGYQGDPERTMWPWRDWAVQALNDNMPFDQFTIEQLAGDLLPDASTDQVLATGFHRNHMHNGEGGRIAEETRVENVMDRAETTATVWLGLTMTCARCHDHKYDPVTQREYYSLYAFFNRLSANGGGRSGQMAPTVTYISSWDQERLRQAEHRIANLERDITDREPSLTSAPAPDESDADASDADAAGAPKPGEPAQPTAEPTAEEAPELPEAVRAALAKPVGQRSDEQWQKLAEHFKTQHAEYAQTIGQLRAARRQRDDLRKSFPKVMVLDDAKPRETFVLVRGTYNKPDAKVEAGVPAVLPALPSDAPPNRLTLARWLVSPDHPLTARVTVNRYWQSIFGRGLVKTVEDLGIQGERPSHPELLDWLAVEFVESGWDVKALHRLIVTSATYRQSSKVTAAQLEWDPDNVYLARAPRYRLPAWMLRDQALATGGLLVGQIGGPPVKPYQPEGVWAEATFNKKRYTRDSGSSLYRRSLYTFWRRIVGPTMFFDTANRQTCTVKLSRTNTPLHALVTLNETTFVESARALAERTLLRAETTDPAGRIRDAFRRVLVREPSAEEQAILQQRLQMLLEAYRTDREAAEQLLGVGESPRNPQLDSAEHAAYTALCSLLLNLDEALSRQ